MFETQRTGRPVHLNLAYRKPFVEDAFAMTDLPPEELEALSRWQARRTPYCTYLQAQPRLAVADVQQLAERIHAAAHIACVVGPLPPTQATTAIRTLATRLGAPLFADINAGLRCDGSSPPYDPGSAGVSPAPVLALYNLYLRGAMASLPPLDLVLYFGDRLLSEPLREYLSAQRPEFLLCSSYPLRQDAVENEFVYPTLKIWGDPCTLAADLLPWLPARAPSALAQALAACETTAQQRLTTLLYPPVATALTEAQLIAAVFQHIHAQSAVFLSASLIVREAEYFVPCRPHTVHVGANRGATGIDGVLSSGVGFGAGWGRPCTVLIGDQALLHDLNALALVATAEFPVYVVVLNNHSGAIFHFFDLGATSERLRNPHPWDFRGAAENFSAGVCASDLAGGFCDSLSGSAVPAAFNRV